MHLNVYILMTDSAWNFNEKVKAYSEVKSCHVIKKTAHMQVDMFSKCTKQTGRREKPR